MRRTGTVAGIAGLERRAQEAYARAWQRWSTVATYDDLQATIDRGVRATAEGSGGWTAARTGT